MAVEAVPLAVDGFLKLVSCFSCLGFGHSILRTKNKSEKKDMMVKKVKGEGKAIKKLKWE